ncbi:hypothetical protein [Mycolicibacterium canariasense]|uniref:hypothetical protein n=1 Tax=Mycolicibacterium canariasense TaxID=228230 RepID=UPI000A168DF0|nr:hypothetical protein [Mycolicibacterium canariasense]MCV7208372.1 hypothetical protein [Mycolicibacterium canariasense]ORV13556.1 hypothetical protein AWB94_04865 [Mycolicibacterium canariasense]
MRLPNWARPGRVPAEWRTIDELRKRATAELLTNPTITVCVIDDDGVEHHRPANPLLRLEDAMQGIVDAFGRLGLAAQDMVERIRDFVLPLGEIDTSSEAAQ